MSGHANLESCGECHAVVFTQDLPAHQKWHDELDRVAESAGYAEGMMRPIG